MTLRPIFSHSTGLLTMAAMALTALASCRTTEANYKAAYEVAKASREAAAQADDGLDADTRERMRQSAAGTVPVIFFAAVDGNVTADSIPHYCVAVNCFRQLFNAKELRARLVKAGYTKAFVGKTANQDYYIFAAGANDMLRAREIMQAIKDDASLPKATSVDYPRIITYAGFKN